MSRNVKKSPSKHSSTENGSENPEERADQVRGVVGFALRVLSWDYKLALRSAFEFSPENESLLPPRRALYDMAKERHTGEGQERNFPVSDDPSIEQSVLEVRELRETIVEADIDEDALDQALRALRGHPDGHQNRSSSCDDHLTTDEDGAEDDNGTEDRVEGARMTLSEEVEGER
ncbi:hypothetical protein MRY87_04090 [bacterium]|nr:hypothetical protein [bacterium]